MCPDRLGRDPAGCLGDRHCFYTRRLSATGCFQGFGQRRLCFFNGDIFQVNVSFHIPHYYHNSGRRKIFLFSQGACYTAVIPKCDLLSS